MTSPEIALSTAHGELQAVLYCDSAGRECLVVFKRSKSEHPFVRIQSSCLFSEAFGSRDCDCALQLDASIEIVAQDGGYLFYIYDEGRGAGLFKKIEGISLEQKYSISTAEAYEKLGIATDSREFATAIEAMKAVGVSRSIRLASNNPRKEELLIKAGFQIEEFVKLKIQTSDRIDSYLRSKQIHLGHRG